MLEALRGMFDRIEVKITEATHEQPYVLAPDFNEAFCAAKGAYLRIRRDLKE